MAWTVSQRAYLAGILDGEGCIYIRKQRDKRKPYYAVQYQCDVVIGNTSKELIAWIAEVFGGHAYFHGQQKAHYRPNYQWRAAGEVAYKILKAIHPYLIIKRPHAEIFFKFRKTLVRTRGAHGRWKTLTPENLALKESYYLAIKELSGRAENARRLLASSASLPSQASSQSERV